MRRGYLLKAASAAVATRRAALDEALGRKRSASGPVRWPSSSGSCEAALLAHFYSRSPLNPGLNLADDLTTRGWRESGPAVNNGAVGGFT